MTDLPSYGKGETIVYIACCNGRYVPIGFSKVVHYRPSKKEYVAEDGSVFDSWGYVSSYPENNKRYQMLNAQVYNVWEAIEKCNIQNRITNEHSFATIKDVLEQYMLESDNDVSKLIRKTEMAQLRHAFYDAYQKYAPIGKQEDVVEMWNNREIKTVDYFFKDDSWKNEVLTEGVNRVRNTAFVTLKNAVSPTVVKHATFKIYSIDALEDPELLKLYFKNHVFDTYKINLWVESYHITDTGDMVRWEQTASFSFKEISDIVNAYYKYIDLCDENDEKLDLDIIALLTGKIALHMYNQQPLD